MFGRIRALGTNQFTYWAVALIAILVWSLIPSYKIGWDFINFRDAIVSLRAGHDPYVDALAVQNAYHSPNAVHVDDVAPISYVYSPATLPFLRLVAHLPFSVSGTLYWMAFAIAFVVLILVGLHWAEDDERRIFAYLAPFAVFFPGLLQSDVLFSGNVAILLYGCVLAAALLGWRKDKWLLFYAFVLIASCFKAPMLSLVAIPALSSRKQWLPSCGAAIAGFGVFCMQSVLWPSLFGNYMKILDCMFRMERDFSSSPTGVLTEMFYNTSSYKEAMTFFYLAYAVPVFCVLLYLAHKFFAGRLTLKQWVPVMLVGVVLLNPRIIEYDVAPLALPMALILWRGFMKNNTQTMAMVKMGALFLGANFLTAINLPVVHLAWRWTESAMLLGLFTVGSSSLVALAREKSFYGEGLLDEVFEESMAEELAL